MTAPDLVGWGFLRSRRWLGYFGIFLLFSLACVWLGNWQFERRAEAQAEIARIDANYDAPSMPLSTALPELGEFDEDLRKWQTVEVRGTYLGEQVLARNRPGGGGVGSNLIAAIQTREGTVFFVDRGWVPVTGADEIPADLPRTPSGEVTVTARLRASEPTVPGRSASGQSVASIHLPELSQRFDAPAYTGAYGQLVSEEPAGETGELPPRPERDEGPHLSYALQWYVFILIAAAGMVYAARQEYRNLNSSDTRVRTQDELREQRRARRGPSDAEEEDALLGG